VWCSLPFLPVLNRFGVEVEAYRHLICATVMIINILGGYTMNAKNIDKKLAQRQNFAILHFVDNLVEQRQCPFS
jgi:hypothetical protein